MRMTARRSETRLRSRTAVLATVFSLLLSAVSAIAGPGTEPVWTLEGAANRVYLVGSIHLLRETDYPLPAGLMEAYADAERLLMELDMDDIDSGRVGAIMFARGTPPEGQTLESLMGPEKFARAQESAAEIGIDLTRFRGAEPWYAALTLTQIQLMRRGYDPRYGIDAHLAAAAMEDGKPIQGLETFEEQIIFFDTLPLDLQSDMLLESLGEMADLEADMGRTVDAWRRGDADYLARELLAELADYPELYERLVVQRNRDWLPVITALTDREEDYLVVVGALHLVGEDGLLALLAEAGIQARQLGSEAAQAISYTPAP